MVLRQKKEIHKDKPFLNSLLGPLVLYCPSLSTAIVIKPSAGPPVQIIKMKTLWQSHKCILCYQKDTYFGLLKIQFLLELCTLVFMLAPQSSHLSFMLAPQWYNSLYKKVPQWCNFLYKIKKKRLIRNIRKLWYYQIWMACTSFSLISAWIWERFSSSLWLALRFTSFLSYSCSIRLTYINAGGQ